jgi:DNA polymerase iota
MIDYNMSLLNHHDLANSFFCLDKQDPTVGFQFDAASYRGPTYPEATENPLSANAVTDDHNLAQRLILGSHLAYYMRSRLDNERGYTATVGISTSKLLSKLVGNVHKPNNQTTLIPPYSSNSRPDEISNVNRFIDSHEIGKIPGIGFKSAQKIRAYILHREATFEPYTERDEKDKVNVREVRLSQTMGPPKILDILGGPGAPRDIGVRTWGLLNGVDNSEVLEARAVPTQISIEDSYMGLQHFEDVKKQLQLLATSLIKRMRTDLIDEDDHSDANEEDGPRWIAHPRTLRLSTRRRSPKNADGSRDYSYANGRISRSGPVPKCMFSLAESAEAVAEKLVDDCLVSMFRKLHPDKAFGELSLINVAVTNMVETAGNDRQSSGRDIGKMFRQQGSIASAAVETNHRQDQMYEGSASGNLPDATLGTQIDGTAWEESDDEEDVPSTQLCDVCGSHIPLFAFRAHALYHAAPD